MAKGNYDKVLLNNKDDNINEKNVLFLTVWEQCVEYYFVEDLTCSYNNEIHTCI